jgi:hypothetical protein
MTEIQDGDAGTLICKRPGCGNAVPPGSGRGRHRVFCGDDCARRYHNDARAPAGGGSGEQDPLAMLEALVRQAAVLVKAARDDAAGLAPARVRAEIADAEAARRRAEATAVTAQARQAETESEAQALAEALAAARDDKSAAETALRHAEDTARALRVELEQVRRDTVQEMAAAQEGVREQITAARADAERAQRERNGAVAVARRSCRRGCRDQPCPPGRSRCPRRNGAGPR